MLIQIMPLLDEADVWYAMYAPRITGLHPSVSASQNMEFSIQWA
jgi:hypothetical protein